MAEERKTDEALEKAVETDEDIDRYIRELTGKIGRASCRERV